MECWACSKPAEARESEVMRVGQSLDDIQAALRQQESLRCQCGTELPDGAHFCHNCGACQDDLRKLDTMDPCKEATPHVVLTEFVVAEKNTQADPVGKDLRTFRCPEGHQLRTGESCGLACDCCQVFCTAGTKIAVCTTCGNGMCMRCASCDGVVSVEAPSIASPQLSPSRQASPQASKPSMMSVPFPEIMDALGGVDTRMSWPQASQPKVLCRICLEGLCYELGPLIRPCKCDDEWVHRSCLNEWRAGGLNPVNLTRCEVCQQNYAFTGDGRAWKIQLAYYSVWCLQAGGFLMLSVFLGRISQRSGFALVLLGDVHGGWFVPETSIGWLLHGAILAMFLIGCMGSVWLLLRVVFLRTRLDQARRRRNAFKKQSRWTQRATAYRSSCRCECLRGCHDSPVCLYGSAMETHYCAACCESCAPCACCCSVCQQAINCCDSCVNCDGDCQNECTCCPASCRSSSGMHALNGPGGDSCLFLACLLIVALFVVTVALFFWCSLFLLVWTIGAHHGHVRQRLVDMWYVDCFAHISVVHRSCCATDEREPMKAA